MFLIISSDPNLLKYILYNINSFLKLKSPILINLCYWIDSEYLNIHWEFLFDQLTVTMIIPVIFISTVIHLFSVDYMSSDPLFG